MTTSQLAPARFRLQSSSGQYSDDRKQTAADFDLSFNRHSHIIGGTEAHANDDAFNLVKAIGKNHGFHVIRHQFGEWIAVDESFGTIVDHGFLPIIPGQPGPASQGGHTPKGLLWVEVESEELGELYVAWGHWVTGYENNPARRKQHAKMTKVFTTEVPKHAQGKALGFFGGDININEQTDLGQDHQKPAWLFKQAHMSTIWDELYPPGADLPSTHAGPRAGTIDIIGSYDKDTRVTGVKVTVHGHGLNKDHRDVIATYDVLPLPTR